MIFSVCGGFVAYADLLSISHSRTPYWIYVWQCRLNKVIIEELGKKVAYIGK
jgi:hypothetical protein